MQCWGLTDPGCVRAQNQDTYLMEQLDRNSLICVVCDGMGGAKSGNVASTLAADVFVQEIKQSWGHGMTADRVERVLRGAVKLANFTVYDQAAQFEEFRGMGLGTEIMAWMEGEYPTARRFRLEVTQVNQRAVRLYEGSGYHYLRYDQMVLDKLD